MSALPLLFALACSAAPKPLTPTAPPAPSPAGTGWETIARVELAAVGDFIPHGMVKISAADAAKLPGATHAGWSALLAGVADELRAADLAFVNLETPVAPKADRGSRPFVFNAPVEALDALQDAGIDLFSFANNHVYDQGRAGLLETIEQLDAHGVVRLGAGRTCEDAAAFRLVEKNGLKLAFLGATKLFNDRMNAGPDAPCAAELDEATVLRNAKAARAAGAELVVLSVHWGVEYAIAPRAEEVAQAHRLLDGGIDAILGTHAHVLQPVEVYATADGRTTFVAYSLGNFFANQARTYAFGVHPDKAGNSRDGVILRVAAVKKRRGAETRVELADLSVQPLWTDNNPLDRQRDAKLPTLIRVVPNDEAAAAAKAALAGAATPAERLQLERRIELLERRRALAAGILGEELLR